MKFQDRFEVFEKRLVGGVAFEIHAPAVSHGKKNENKRPRGMDILLDLLTNEIKIISYG